MRLAMLGFFHESNTFAATRVDAAQWRRATLRGDAIVARYSGSDSTVGGFLHHAQSRDDIDLVPLSFAWMTPSGPSEQEAWEELCEGLLAELAEHGPWDGVLLPQHGAAVADGHLDADAEFVSRVRGVVGDEVVIGVALDMHANISERMVESADILTVYQTNPHVDAAFQAFRCAELVAETVRGRIAPVLALARLPLAINILVQGTEDEPVASMLRLVHGVEREQGVLLAQLAEGFPYADVPAMGASIVVMTDRDAALARRIAADVADEVWARRADFRGTPVAAHDAFDGVSTQRGRPVLILDTGDNVWAGSAGDGTQLLHEARRQGVRDVGFAIVDPTVAAAATRLGPNARISMAIGATIDPRYGHPFPFTGTVLATHVGSFAVEGMTHLGNRHFDLGATAGIRTDDGLEIAVHTLPSSTVSLEHFRIAGIEPTTLAAIVAKGVHSPRAAFEPVVRELRWVGSVGCTTADLGLLTYRHALR